MSADRFKSAILAIVRELVPNARFYAPVRYRVTKAQDGKFSATPEKSASGFPTITDAPIRGVPGGNAASKLKSGTSILVSFVEGDPGDPFLSWIDEGAAPDELALEAQTKATVTAPTVEVSATTVTISAATTEIGTAPSGVATALTSAPQLGLEAAERTAFQAFFNFPGVIAISGGTAAAAAAASAAAAVGAALPTNFSQTVKAGA